MIKSRQEKKFGRGTYPSLQMPNVTVAMVAAPDQNGQNAPLFGQKRSLKRVKLDRGGTSLLIKS